MPPEIRRGFLILAGLVAVGMFVWAARFQPMPPAEFSFQNGTDPKTLDPHRATGRPEMRLLINLFAGLLQGLPEGPVDPETGLQPMTPQPSIAKSFEVSEDGRLYTFHLRDDAKWSDGVPIKADDFVWSWTRMLHPATACEYTFQLFSVPHARQYSRGEVDVGDRVEVELWDRPGETEFGEANIQHFPRGTIRYGTLTEILKPDRPKLPESLSEDARQQAVLQWQDDWVYVVDMASVDSAGEVDWDESLGRQSFSLRHRTSPVARDDTRRTHGVLVAFDKLGGVKAVDDSTLEVRLNDPLPYFLNLVAYPALCAVPRHVIEKHGAPLWTKAENIVSSGPYRVGDRLLRDRVRLVKNEHYFDADTVAIHSIDAISTESRNTALNMYETGQLQWVFDPPALLVTELKKRDDFLVAPMLSVYFYRINVNRPPMDDARVRRAIAMAIDRDQIVSRVTKAGQIPAYSLVPPGIAGYESPLGFRADLVEAERLLAEAGYPDGRGFPKVSILYNTQEMHRAIAEVIQQQLLNTLHIKVDLQNMEWGSYLDKVNQLDYDIARGGWIADYPDPNTFLDLWVTGGDQNSTGWGNDRYDELIEAAASEGNVEKRMGLL